VVLTEVETRSLTLDDTRYLQEASGESNLVPPHFGRYVGGGLAVCA